MAPDHGPQAVIPAGEFLAGDPPRPARTGAFQIDLLPVTVSQFGTFIESGGYREPGSFSEAGRAWLLAHSIALPRFWGEEAWAGYLKPDHPVVGVSFFEAQAYARHAGRRLPSELEWERAARGEDGRQYPWGDAWDPMRSHHRGGARHTLAVGSFPSGASPYGLLDAAGNVWEWCEGLFDPATPSVRAARGGGWNAWPLQLRCASRNGWPEDARFSNLGFRTAR